MRAMFAGALALVLAGCGGGDGGGDGSPPITIAWSQPSYILTRPQSSLDASVLLGGRDLPPILGVNVSTTPSGGGASGVFFMNSAKSAPVRLAAPVAPGGTSYAAGTFTVTAMVEVNGAQYRATTTLVVQ